MGSDCSHMNVFAISFIAAAKYDDCENILLKIENRPSRSHLEAIWKERMAHRTSGVLTRNSVAHDDVYEYRGNKWRRKGSANTSIGKRISTGNESDYSDDDSNTPASEKPKLLSDGEPSSFAAAAALAIPPDSDVNKETECEEEGGNEILATDDNVRSQEGVHIGLPNYMVDPAGLASLLESRGLQTSDIDLMLTLFSLIDKRGLKSVDVRDVLLSFLVVASASVSDCLRGAFRLYDRTHSTVTAKDGMIHVLGTLSRACGYFGDRALSQSQVVDLVDSLFTLAGKVDGCISYEDYHDLIVKHPIVEMMLSIQFQGPVRDKILDEEKIYALDIVV